MPPKRKVGRPPGSKNKKGRKTCKKIVKKKPVSIIRVEKEKDERSSNSNDCTTSDENVCGVCQNMFNSKDELGTHHERCRALEIVSDYFPKAAYTCNECPKKFRFKKSFIEHCKNEHSKSPKRVACSQCNVYCPDTKTLKEHIAKVHERDIYECPTCQRQFVRRSHVLRHMAQTGCDGQGAAEYSCEICHVTFTRKDNLMVHIRLQHIVRNGYKCKSCKFDSKNFSKLVAHWHANHAETPGQYQCNTCSKWTSSRAAMTKHLEIHGEKKYACDVKLRDVGVWLQCGYSTYTIEVMRRHVLTHVSEKPYKCEICSKSYIQRAQLQRHLEIHTGNLCTKCETPFPSRAKLLVHMREHMGLDKLHCPIKTCTYYTKAFSTESGLNHHLKTHGDDKPYSCEVCDKKFHSDMNLRRHLETHTLDKPRRCMYCVSARAYVRGAQLLRHVRKNHDSIFRGHLLHVRQVLGADSTAERVKKSELDAILNLLDVESDRILQGYSGADVLYGGMQDDENRASKEVPNNEPKKVNSPLLSEDELTENLRKLLSKLIDKETLHLFGWPDESVDVVLEKVIEQCGAKPADREKWTRVQRLRENSKHLFLYVIEDKNIARMLGTHTIDQIVKHILKQVSDDDANEI
ncbi:zinc finger protein 569-like isoform X2 [Spodoptera litura]|uniref:Zinc finger protein 569-like isoform X2 n=1 Tax=Spodoptera litura TaxID=69820 RepID=A0A9J7INJ4_SPOLT|nr:zinc finger protein 569-like isoform X2 [Spodoptera litura]